MTSNGADRIAAIEPVPGDPSKVRVLLQSGEAIVIRLRSWTDLNLKVGLPLDVDVRARIVEAAASDSAFELAIRYLRVKPRTKSEVSSYLQRKGVDLKRLPDVLNHLSSRGLVDDAAYSRAFTLQKQSSLSRREIASQLKRRGIRLSEVQTTDDADAARQAEWTAAELAARKYLRIHTKGDLRTRRMKLAAHLQRRGFPADVIRRTLTSVASEIPFSDSEFSFEDPDF